MAYTHKGYQIITSLSACLAFSVFLVLLRFCARLRRRRAPMLGDYVVLVGLGAFTAYAAVLYTMVNNPDGSIEPSEMKHTASVLLVFHYAIITEILLPVIITLVKVSILLFYREIFVSPQFRRLNTCCIGVCLVWFLTVFFVLILQCNPPAAAWNYQLVSGSGKCLALSNIIMGMEITNIFVDVLIMILPVPEMRKLRVRRSRKIMTSIIFMVGGFVAVTSAIRIYYARPRGKIGTTTSGSEGASSAKPVVTCSMRSLSKDSGVPNEQYEVEAIHMERL